MEAAPLRKIPKVEVGGSDFLWKSTIRKVQSESNSSSISKNSFNDSSNLAATGDKSDRSDSELDHEVKQEFECPRAKKIKTTSHDAGYEEPRKISRTKMTAKRADYSGPKQRTTNPGRRTVGKRVYDSVLGKTCHWCRQKTVELHVECSTCPIRFCGMCLLNRNGEVVMDEMMIRWVCPKCRGGCGPGCQNCCNCGPCRKSQGLEPTGQLIATVRRAGFENVHDYLVHLKTNDDSEVIGRRKEGRGWTKATGALGRIDDTDDERGQTKGLTQGVNKQNYAAFDTDVAGGLKSKQGQAVAPQEVNSLENTAKGRLCIGGTDYARQLAIVLRRPFSMLQLKQMLEHIKFRKPVMKLRQTRRRSIEVPGNLAGLSYLDHYPDLAENLNNTSLPEEKLKLLRGFFFWLQHACMEGAFRPWAQTAEEDGGECMEINGPDCQIICVLLAIDDDENAPGRATPVGWEDQKPEIGEDGLSKLKSDVTKAFFVPVKLENKD